MAQLVASMSGVVLGGVVMVVGSNLAKGKIFTASIGSVDSLYPSVYKKLYILVYIIYKKKNIYTREKSVSKSKCLWGTGSGKNTDTKSIAFQNTCPILYK